MLIAYVSVLVLVLVGANPVNFNQQSTYITKSLTKGFSQSINEEQEKEAEGEDDEAQMITYSAHLYASCFHTQLENKSYGVVCLTPSGNTTKIYLRYRSLQI